MSDVFSWTLLTAFTEMWPEEENVDQVQIENYWYDHFYRYREHTRGGGVSLHVHNRLAAIERKDLCIMSECMESYCDEIDKKQQVLIKIW